MELGGPFFLGARWALVSGAWFEVEGGVLWFWVGSHADYDRIVG
jgi:hypothetical protein